MDPISITASLVAILGIAGSAAKLSKTLYSVANKSGPAALGIRRFVLDITTFASIIRLAHKYLHDHLNEQKRLQPSLILQSIEKDKVIDQLVSQSESVIDHIKLVRPRLKSINGRFAFITRLKWLLMRPEIETLSLRIESAKTNLHLIIVLVTLEATMQKIPSDENRQRIKELRRQVRQYVRMIRDLEEHIERDNINTSRDVAQPAQDAVVNLGHRMTRNSRRSSSARSPSFRRSLQAYHIQEPENLSNLVNEEPPPPRMLSQSIISGLDLSVVPTTTRTSLPMPNVVQTRNSSSSLSSSRSRPTPIARNDGDFVSVRPIDNVLELSTDHEIESVTGYINSVYITAILDHDFDTNVISQAEAVRIGLEIQPPGEDNVSIKFGDNQEQAEPCVGTVTFEWSEGPSSTKRPFTVYCFVCTHNIQTIILGRPFKERLAHYWNREFRA